MAEKQPVERSRSTKTEAREDAESIFEESRHRSEADAKQHAREAAASDTQPRTPHGASEPRHYDIDQTE